MGLKVLLEALLKFAFAKSNVLTNFTDNEIHHHSIILIIIIALTKCVASCNTKFDIIIYPFLNKKH